ncbi:MAG: ribosome small subunit-dependent GTPase A [Oscillospiraceae bacterium]|nr:ribosome small subunit-dependent GTPase A [Oscillospiraceae bacterium]
MIEKTDIANIYNYGFTPAMMPSDAQGTPARVTAVHKERYEIVCEYGACFGKLKTSVYYGSGIVSEGFPTTGDFVLIQYNKSGDSQIVKTLERKSFFSRLDPTPGRGEQTVAANFDYVFIMQSLNQGYKNFNIKRLERYLTAAWQSGAVPVIVLTKSDLADDYTEQLREVQKAAAGAGVFAISAKTGFGLDSLAEYLKPRKTIVFLGSSGVGKSSLVNALAGEEIMETNETRDSDSKGRHTTTRRQLIMMPGGYMLIDTPGMRALGMWDVSDGLGEAFSDVEQYFGKCKFSDCKHQSEPGCAVKSAIESGKLPRKRWDSYVNIKHEAKYSDDKTEYLRSQKELHKKWAKEAKSDRKKSGGKRRYEE